MGDDGDLPDPIRALRELAEKQAADPTFRKIAEQMKAFRESPFAQQLRDFREKNAAGLTRFRSQFLATTAMPAAPAAAPVPASADTAAVAGVIGPEPPATKRLSRQRAKQPYETTQRKIARAVLRRLFPDGYPIKQELSAADLMDRFSQEYARVEGKTATRYDPPSKTTVFRELGWRD